MALSAQVGAQDRISVAAQRYGAAAVEGARALEQTMVGLTGREEQAQVRAVNDLFNSRIAYKDDTANWGQLDYWASPLESLQKGAGDCEDYAIAKYFTLVSLGVPHPKLRLVYVRARIPNAPNGYIAHMVLAYYAQADAEPLVLDNLLPELRPAGRRPDLTPVFSFNAEGLWEGVGAVRASGDPLTRLSHWRQVLLRARGEGFQ